MLVFFPPRTPERHKKTADAFMTDTRGRTKSKEMGYYFPAVAGAGSFGSNIFLSSRLPMPRSAQMRAL